MMEQSAQLSTLFAQYDKLCQYCDAQFQYTFQAFQPYMQCQKGCADCCLLEAVLPLEAAVIASYLESLETNEKKRVFGNNPLFTPRETGKESQEDSPCVFLSPERICLIYPVRPLICRTHGLPLTYPERPVPDTCPLNFQVYNLAQIEPRYVLDVENITTNLLRLNLAYHILTEGSPDAAGKRIPLRRILADSRGDPV